MATIFAICGLFASSALCLIDLVTSYNGVKAVMPLDTESIILKTIPFLFAILATTFNGTSAHLFRHFRRNKYGGLASFILLVAWINFLAYDWVTSFAGIVSEFAGESMGSVELIISTFIELSSGQKYVVIAVAILASSGPFLASAFCDLLKEQLAEREAKEE